MSRDISCARVACRVLLALCCLGAAADDVLAPLDLRSVKLGGEMGRRIDITIHNNLLVLNPDKDFLPPFEKRSAKDGFIGLGNLIDAAVSFAANTGDPKVIALKDRLVRFVIEHQDADGYVGMLSPEKRISGLWDVHEMAYLARGLVRNYELFGDRPSLDAARKMADYIISNWKAIPPDWPAHTQVATHVAVTGLERMLLALARATGDSKYVDFVVKTRALPAWDMPIAMGRRAGIEGHIYGYVTECLAQLELYRTQPSPALLASSDRAVDFMTRRDGAAISGGAGQWEIWTDDQDVRGEFAETCATAYQIRLYDSLLRLRGEPRYGDLMERTIYNTLFAAQSPDGRRLRYFSPLEGPRVYHPTDTYCCPCNYRRAVAELPTFAYYKSADGVAVNLYGASTATIEVDAATRVVVKQETDYPNSGTVTLHVDPSQERAMALRLRIPAWATEAKVAINGQAASVPAAPGTFAVIQRTWKAGDVVTLEMPMHWRLVRGRQRQAGRVAVMRGPVLFCLNPAQNKALATRDAADVGRISLDPSTIAADPLPDTTVRPDGLACHLRAWAPSFGGLTDHGDMDLRLTEFPDPDGTATYFRLRDFTPAVEDELMHPVAR